MNASNRIDDFIVNQGGIVSLQKRALDYTFGIDFPKHSILNNAAKSAYDKLKEAEPYVAPYSSRDESIALTYAFIQKLKQLR
jgi:hypothetical protein